MPALDHRFVSLPLEITRAVDGPVGELSGGSKRHRNRRNVGILVGARQSFNNATPLSLLRAPIWCDVDVLEAGQLGHRWRRARAPLLPAACGVFRLSVRD